MIHPTDFDAAATGPPPVATAVSAIPHRSALITFFSVCHFLGAALLTGIAMGISARLRDPAAEANVAASVVLLIICLALALLMLARGIRPWRLQPVGRTAIDPHGQYIVRIGTQNIGPLSVNDIRQRSQTWLKAAMPIEVATAGSQTFVPLQRFLDLL